MPKFLVEYELKSLGIFSGTNEIEFTHPRMPAKITLREKRVDLNEEYAILGAYVVLEAQSLEESSERSESILSEFVHALKLATSLDIQVNRKLKVIEWTEGLAERKCWFIDKFVGDERPYKVLSQDLIKTVELLTSEEIPSALRRAIRWFSLAVSAKYLDEQFQCFWFSIEILAQLVKPPDKVPSTCVKCHQPLYCEGCDDYPKHRPFPKQAIQFVFSKVVADKPDEAFDMCNQVRNRLMHGDSLEEIEKDIEVEFPRIVDNIGHIAWNALRSVIRITLENLRKDVRVEFLQTNTFCQMIGVVHAHITYLSPDPDNPTIGEWPEPELKIERNSNIGDI